MKQIGGYLIRLDKVSFVGSFSNELSSVKLVVDGVTLSIYPTKKQYEQLMKALEPEL